MTSHDRNVVKLGKEANMKVKYVLDGTINGYPITPRSFLSRREAEKRLYDILTRSNLQVEDDRRPEPHTEEFVCSYHTRFFVRRIVD